MTFINTTTKQIDNQYIHIADNIALPTGRVRRKPRNAVKQRKPKVYVPKATWAKALAQLEVGQRMVVLNDTVRTSLYIFAKRLKYRIRIQNDHTGIGWMRCYRLDNNAAPLTSGSIFSNKSSIYK